MVVGCDMVATLKLNLHSLHNYIKPALKAESLQDEHTCVMPHGEDPVHTHVPVLIELSRLGRYLNGFVLNLLGWDTCRPDRHWGVFP